MALTPGGIGVKVSWSRRVHNVLSRSGSSHGAGREPGRLPSRSPALDVVPRQNGHHRCDCHGDAWLTKETGFDLFKDSVEQSFSVLCY